jgi:DNA-binding transcriptional MerR regulator
MVSQLEVLERLEDEGYEVSKRTLGYWRGKGLLPPLERDGQQYYWEEGIIDRVKDLCSKREESVLYKIDLDGQEFSVERVEIKRLRGEVKAIIYLSDDQFIIKRVREELLNAISIS